MKYRNTVTGEVRDFACTLSGGNWEALKPPTPVKEDNDKKPVKKTIKTK